MKVQMHSFDGKCLGVVRRKQTSLEAQQRVDEQIYRSCECFTGYYQTSDTELVCC